MALRDKRVRAVVIGSKKVGEIHKLISIISPELGFQTVMIYGGRKGKKTSSGELFSYGSLLLHYDPIKNYYSLVEDECSFSPVNILSSVKAVFCASALCEIAAAFKTDNYEELYYLMVSALEILSNNLESYIKIIVDFSWKVLLSSGSVSFPFSYCISCGKKLLENEDLAFSNYFLNFTCTDCSDDTTFRMLPGSRRYLTFTSEMNLFDAFNVGLSEQAQIRLFKLLTRYIEILFHININSLKGLIE